MKKQNIIPIIALLALVSMMIAPVCAETLTGTLSHTNISSLAYQASAGTGSMDYTGLTVGNIELSGDAFALVQFWLPYGGAGAKLPTYDASAANITGAATSTNFRLSNNTFMLKTGNIIGSGAIGYQRIFNTAIPPVEQQGGYFWVTFDNWNISGLSGNTYIYMDYSRSNLNNITAGSGTGGTIESGKIYVGGSGVNNYFSQGNYTLNTDYGFTNSYTVTKPQGLGISGIVDKSGSSTNTKVFIFDSNNQIITSENIASKNSFIVNTDKAQIKIGILGGDNIFVNSSLLFAAAVPTVTPTPVPTIPPGYIQTEIATIDVYGARISGTNINILDNEAGVWTNSTNDADGLSSVITLPYHTLNVYGSYTQVANQYADNSLIGINTGFDGGIRFYLILYPYTSTTGPGNTQLYVTVKETVGLAPIANAIVKIGILNNATLIGHTTPSGVQTFTVPNQTVLHITAEKPGYITNGIVINSGSGTTAFANIVLDRLTVTPVPTATIGPGGTTPVYVDPNDPVLHGGDTSLKAQEMMNWIAMNGMSLVQLCFLVTIFALLGVKLGK